MKGSECWARGHEAVNASPPMIRMSPSSPHRPWAAAEGRSRLYAAGCFRA